ncbi:hypothetical protein C0Q70_06495 [Pomacea canaliculata]|uniref:Uncharacterized protein n=1 Tax=Pomacea canaliculata TaxID=400727 RepID=A0A2T7PP58_POMCA|nr:hypothetical protein C0Q70_06495 [Pomacea canaliculata]
MTTTVDRMQHGRLRPAVLHHVWVSSQSRPLGGRAGHRCSQPPAIVTGRPHLMSVCVQKQKYHGIVGSCNPACPNNEGQTLLFADSPAAAMLQSGTGGDTGDDDERSRPTETPDGGDTNRPLLATEASEERSSEQAQKELVRNQKTMGSLMTRDGHGWL